MAKSPSYPKTIKISVPYEFKIANKDTYEFLKRNLSVSNLTALQTSVKDYLEEYLKDNENKFTIWKQVKPLPEKEDFLEEPIKKKTGLPWE